MRSDALDVTDLTPITRMLVAAIDVDGTYRLLRLRGNRRTYIPASGDAQRTALTDVLSATEVAALAACPLAGRHIDLPGIGQFLIARRNHAIRAAPAHVSAAELARRWGLSTRQVRHIRNGRAAR